MLKPVNDWHLIELVPPVDRTDGGIYLSQRWTYNDTTGVVLASGPGLALSGGLRSVQWAEPGQVVLVDPKCAWPAPEPRQVFSKDADLLAVVDGETVRPLNDLALILPDSGERERNGIAIPDRWQRVRGRSGIVVAFGPGRIRPGGKWRGTRTSIHAILGVEPVHEGDRVYWEHESNAIAVGRHSLSALLVRTHHLIAVSHE